MRLGTIRTNGGFRVVAVTDYGWLDAGHALHSDAGLVGNLSELIGADDDTLQRVEAAVVSVNAHGVIPSAFLYSPDERRLAPPLPAPTHIFCVGQNYRTHVLEQGLEMPKVPEIFLRTCTTLVGPRDDIWIPVPSSQLDLEVELAVVIGKGGRHIPRDSAMEAVFGYTVFNDVSARDLQFRGTQWTPGKNCDRTAPCGPFIVTRDELPDPPVFRLGADIDGVPMQESQTGDLIFDVPSLIADLSSFVTLCPGDLIATGTPGGVGMFRTPQRWLKVGETVRCWIEGVGELINRVVTEP